MNTEEFRLAYRIAKTDTNLPQDLSPFLGFGLSSFKEVVVTVFQVASLIRYQCFQFDGGIDNGALTQIRQAGRKKFIIV